MLSLDSRVKAKILEIACSQYRQFLTMKEATLKVEQPIEDSCWEIGEGADLEFDEDPHSKLTEHKVALLSNFRGQIEASRHLNAAQISTILTICNFNIPMYYDYDTWDEAFNDTTIDDKVSGLYMTLNEKFEEVFTLYTPKPQPKPSYTPRHFKHHHKAGNKKRNASFMHHHTTSDAYDGIDAHTLGIAGRF